MIFDLNNKAPNSIINKKMDVCIVGGGTAGIYLSQALQKSNLNILLVELGGASTQDAESSFLKPQFTAKEYRGASLGRFSGLGGTSAKWGGQMIELSENDFVNNNFDGNMGWPISKKDLDQYYDKVLKTFSIYKPKANESLNYKTSKLILESELKNSFKLRTSSWIPFKKRNFAKNFDDILRKSLNLEVCLNAKLNSVLDAEWSHDVLENLTFFGTKNQTLVVSSKVFVFTMGALESTRHVLELNKKNSGTLNSSTPFCEHLSTSVGYLKIKKKSLFLDYFSPFFLNGIMRSHRFELNKSAQEKLKIPSAFIHFVTEIENGSALELLKNIARKFQGDNIKISYSKINLFKLIYDLFFIFFWRLFKKKLILNQNGEVQILIDIEQIPNQINNASNIDGNLFLNWTISDYDKSIVTKTAQEFYDCWSSSKTLSEIADVVLHPVSEINNGNFFDVHHPTGSIPFGHSPSKSVLDKNLRIWKTQNLFVSSTAVFPTAGSANPGLTHLALTQRLADHISNMLLKK
jgi:hypothetical protein